MQRIEARRQLWSPYQQLLEGTRHAGAFRRTVFQQLRTPGLDRRRAPLLPQRLAQPHPTGTLVPVRERS